MPTPRLITTSADLETAVHALHGSPRIALDTEGNGMHAFQTRLCVIQICVASPDVPADDVFVIDPLELTDLRALGELLSSREPEVIIHDLAFDARLLRAVGIQLARVFDTALHARFLGLKETGLSALLAARQGVEISKAMQHDDWGKRPLTEGQLQYLIGDVAYLGPLAASLENDAAALGIAEEVRVETEYALHNALAGESLLPGYARVKGVRELTAAARAVFRAVWLVREGIAAQDDVPSGRVVSNALLLTVAKRPPTTIAELRRMTGLRDSPLAADFLSAVEHGIAAGDVPEEERENFVKEPHGRGEISLRRARESALTAWRVKESTARGVDPQVVLPGHALSEIAKRAPATLDALRTVEGIGEVRVARDGETILTTVAQAVVATKEK